MWNGDTFTTPRPFDLAQVSRAFDGESAPFPVLCEDGVAGVPAVEFSSSDGGRHGVVAVFPTTAALMSAYPEAAKSAGSTSPPQGLLDCLQVVWISRGNLLVGVEDGLPDDWFLSQVRAKLEALQAAL